MDLEIIKNGITLKKINENDLELIRNWRNSDFVKQFMIYKENITPEMQKKWYESINNEFNYYFIVLSQDTPVGLANLKDIDYKLNTAEWGVFLSSSKYLNGIIGIQTTISLLEFAFNELELQLVRSSILLSNESAIKFNKQLGVNVIYGGNDIVKGELKKINFNQKNAIFKKILRKYIK
jgi:UDP-4-amino-4,6-dideoxy-N-acetyl-beta-L-altrosamine N-acetyltransferase